MSLADAPHRFLPGERVRVVSDHWDHAIAGRCGTVGAYPDGVVGQEGAVWVDLDVAEWKPGCIDGAEVAEGLLRRDASG